MPPKRKLTEEEKLNLIDCVGFDGNKHSMLAWETQCLCGLGVKHKRTFTGMECNFDFSCYECDSIIDGSYWGE